MQVLIYIVYTHIHTHAHTHTHTHTHTIRKSVCFLASLHSCQFLMFACTFSSLSWCVRCSATCSHILFCQLFMELVQCTSYTHGCMQHRQGKARFVGLDGLNVVSMYSAYHTFRNVILTLPLRLHIYHLLKTLLIMVAIVN